MKLRIPDFSSASVLVFGDLMLDRYWHGDISRISPEAPVPVVNVSNIENRLGGAGNVGLSVSCLGSQVRLLSTVGDDEPAESLRQLLDAANIQHSLLPVDGNHTITKLRVISQNQQLIRLDFEDGFINAGQQQAFEQYTSLLSSCDVVVLSDYSKGTLRDHQSLIRAARDLGKAVLIDPKGSDYSIYKGATLLTPNQAEFEAVAGPCASEAEFMDKGAGLCESLDLDALLVTRSEKGMVLFQRNKDVYVQPTKAREVYDVTGAGDTVIATLAASLAAGVDLKDAVQLSNLAAGVVVGKLGTSTVNTTELQQAMLEHAPLDRGVVSTEALSDLLIQAKMSGEKIVFTNGCFDILHAGHVAYLAEAAELGDRLIVALNSDESVKRLKGPERPINTVDRRMAVVAGLKNVDWVVSFSEDTPQRLIAACLPDVLVKGGDYKPEDIVGSDAVIANGGEVKVLNFMDGCSTSSIIQSIKE